MKDGWGFEIVYFDTIPFWMQNFLGLVFLAIVLLLAYNIKRTPEELSQWHEHHAPPWKRIVFIDGTVEWGPLPIYRRRTPDHQWEYRRLSDGEMNQWNKDQAI